MMNMQASSQPIHMEAMALARLNNMENIVASKTEALATAAEVNINLFCFSIFVSA